MSAWASASEQAAVVSMELVRYTRVISGTSMYQSCRVAIASAWRRVRFVHRWLERGALCSAVAERAGAQRPRNISRQPASDCWERRRFWGVFIIAVHRAFVLNLGARHRGVVELSERV